MADQKISDLAELTAPATDDELVIVDKSDTTMAASGTDKRLLVQTVLPGYGQAGWKPPGTIIESYDRPRSRTDDLTPLTSARLFLVAIADPIPAGQTITDLSAVSGSVAAGTPLNQWFCLVDQSFDVLRKTVDDTTTAWAADTQKTLALSSTYTPSVDTYVFVGIVVKATTVPRLCGILYSRTTVANLAPILGGNSTTGLTDPASLGATCTAAAASNSTPYVRLS